MLLGFDDVLRDRVDDEECRVDDRPPFISIGGEIKSVRQAENCPLFQPGGAPFSERTPKEVNGAAHLSAHAEFLSMNRTSSFEHFSAGVIRRCGDKVSRPEELFERLYPTHRRLAGYDRHSLL